MVALNLMPDDDSVSVYARRLAHEGVVILKCYRANNAYHIKVSSRLNFDHVYGLVDWYVCRQFSGKVVSVNVGDWPMKGDLLFTFTGEV